MSPERVLLESQVKRIVTKLFKDFLNVTEDIRQDHLSALSDLKQFPPEFINRLNYLDLPTYSKIRKRVLDNANDSIREISNLLDSFDISVKK